MNFLKRLWNKLFRKRKVVTGAHAVVYLDGKVLFEMKVSGYSISSPVEPIAVLGQFQPTEPSKFYGTFAGEIVQKSDEDK